MKTAIYGGTFNPPHLGHTHVIEEVIAAIRPDRFLVIPAAIPPHKEIAENSPSFEPRMEMCRLAFSGIPGVEISDMESRREGKSYTVDTLRQLKKEYGEDTDFYLVIGTDQLLALRTWYCFRDLLRLCTPVVVPRDSEHTEELRREADSLAAEFNASLILLDCAPLAVSSTQVRSDPEGSSFLCPAVRDYIRNNGFYRTDETR